jgi:hypothetical protein
MGFTTPCFIRKNTDNIRNRLKEVGYKMLSPIEYDNLECSDNWVNDIKSLNDCNGINCGFNEELFLAIAALRDDSNYMQWFIADSILSVSYSDSIGNDHYFIEPKGIMFFWDENWDNATIISGRYHKATVDELIEHFKIKENNESKVF